MPIMAVLDVGNMFSYIFGLSREKYVAFAIKWRFPITIMKSESVDAFCIFGTSERN